MKLKEAYALTKHLTTLHNNATRFLQLGYHMKQVQHNYYGNTGIDKEDDYKEMPVIYEKPFEFTVEEILDFTMDLISEKSSLNEAIDKAKHTRDFCVDSMKQRNIGIQSVITCLENLRDVKESRKRGYDTLYLRDVEGKQAAFRYDIEIVTTYDIDKTSVRDWLKTLRQEANIVSLEIEAIEAGTDVDFVSKYSLEDSLEDAFQTWKSLQ